MKSTLVAQNATVQSLFSKDLEGIPGKELSMIAVDYPPGAVDPVHTHHAQALVYVLEGSIVMQVKGGAPVTLTRRPGGQPDDQDHQHRRAPDARGAGALIPASQPAGPRRPSCRAATLVTRRDIRIAA